MATNEKSVQDTFLEEMKKKETYVSIYLVSGIKLGGKINNFDKDNILFTAQKGVQLVYKHAVATVVPDDQKDNKK